MVPMPFSRGLFVFGEPIEVPHGADAQQLTAAGAAVERALEELTQRAERGA